MLLGTTKSVGQSRLEEGLGQEMLQQRRHSAKSVMSLACIIHEHFCCDRGFAAATSLRRAGSPLTPSTYCSSASRK